MCAGCEAGQFRCGSGRCIPGDWHCDGTSDCVDDSDEQGCREFLIAWNLTGFKIFTVKHVNNDMSVCVSTAQVTCDNSHFQCLSDGECIPEVWVCDNEEDCEDGSDERQHCRKYIWQKLGETFFNSKTKIRGFCLIHNGLIRASVKRKMFRHMLKKMFWLHAVQEEYDEDYVFTITLHFGLSWQDVHQWPVQLQ